MPKLLNRLMHQFGDLMRLVYYRTCNLMMVLTGWLASLFFALTIISCNEKEQGWPVLDHYGAFQNTKLQVEIEGDVDSCRFQIRNGQPLNGLELFDTTLVFVHGGASLSLNVTLERPSIVLLTADTRQREIFLVPGCNNDFRIMLKKDSLTLHFKNGDLRRINHYYQNKAEIGGDMFLRPLLTSVVTLPTLSAAMDSIQAVEDRLHQLLLSDSSTNLLPSWFIRYEQKNIHLFALSMRVGAPRVRRKLFEMEDTLPDNFILKKHKFDFDVDDEDALTTQHFLSLLRILFLMDSIAFEIDELDPAIRMSLLYEKSKSISSVRVRDVLRSQLLYRMLRSSDHYPDSLVQSVKEGISVAMHIYIDRLDRMYNQLNGLPAPPIHLLDTTGGLTSLKDFRGALVLLYFWFVGCRFCKLEQPFISEIIEEFKDEDFQVIQICMKSEVDIWKKLKHEFVGLPLYSNEHWDKKLERSYKIAGFPRYVLIDKGGKVLEGWCARPSDPILKQRIANYFKQEGNQYRDAK